MLAKKELRVRVTFTSHCFSEAYDPVTHGPGDSIVDKDTKRWRTYCPVRDELSKDLSKVISALIDEEVWQSATERNWVYSTTVEVPAGPYHVFFEVQKASPDQRTWQDVNLIVESAYPQTGSPPSLKGKKPFALVCGEEYTGRRRPAKKR